MDFITNVFTAHKDTLMSPITWCIVLAVLGVIGYFLLMRETGSESQKVSQKQFESVPTEDHVMDHGEHPDHEETHAPEMETQEEAVAYDSSESQHVEA
jgi:hypothetical protein